VNTPGLKSASFFKRLAKFQDADESDKAFSQRLGVKLTTFTSWKAGCFPRLSSIEHVSKVLGINPGWLAFEEGKTGNANALMQ